MPTDNNLPTSVILYLELIEKLMDISDNYDSGSEQSKIIIYQIERYLEKIMNDMSVHIEELKK